MGSKLLLADDSITIQKVVGIIFANEEYDLTVVDSGTAVMAKAQEIRPDIILIDALMPGKSGYEVCEEVRRDPVLKGTPLLLLTGAFEPFDEGKAKSSGADDFISKPFESQHLIDKVKKLIETGRSRVSAQPAAAKPTPPPQPQAAPAAPPARPMQAAAPAPPQPVRPATPQRQEVPDIVFEEPTKGEIVMEASSSDFVVDATPEEDLWGAIETGSDADDAFVFNDTGVAPSLPIVEPPSDFTFGEEESAPSFATSDAEALDGSSFIFEEPAAAPATVESSSALSEREFVFTEESFSEEPEMAAAPALTGGPMEFAFQDEPLAPPPPKPVAAPPVRPSAPSISAPPPSASLPSGGMSEDQLKAALSTMSREVIERIVWEVVPDLAETIIKEEIRKIKSGK